MRPRFRACRNRRCGVMLEGRETYLCPSCTFIGKAGLFVGALLAGVVAWLVK